MSLTEPFDQTDGIIFNGFIMANDGNNLAAVLSRINKRLAKVGLSDRAASLAATDSDDTIRGMRRQFRLGTQKSTTLRTLRLLAVPLCTTAEWLASGAGQEETGEGEPGPGVASFGISILGEVAAGAWLEIDGDQVDTPKYSIKLGADPRYPVDWQYGLLVRGNSINRVANDGTFLICVDIAKSGLSLRNGDLVIAEQIRKQAGLREVTAKRYGMSGRNVTLSPDSTERRYNDKNDPHYQGPITLGTSRKSDTEVVARALVIGVYRLVQRGQE